jgi:hypothetical protein
MNFSANIIEEWLLTGKAVLKNLSCGNAGLVQIPVPEGKTYIITKIEILPFANIIDDDEVIADQTTFEEIKTQTFDGINQRNQFQLLFWNERVNNTWNIRNDISLSLINGLTSMQTSPSYYFVKQIIDCFMVVESNSFLFLKYIDYRGLNATLTQAQLNSIFNINWPPSPDFGYQDQYDIIEYVSNSASGDSSYNYTPQGLNTSFSSPSNSFNDQFVLPANPLAGGGSAYNTFVPPLPLGPGEVGGDLRSYMINSIPLYNIQYIEVNRRLSTTGLL